MFNAHTLAFALDLKDKDVLTLVVKMKGTLALVGKNSAIQLLLLYKG